MAPRNAPNLPGCQTVPDRHTHGIGSIPSTATTNIHSRGREGADPPSITSLHGGGRRRNRQEPGACERAPSHPAGPPKNLEPPRKPSGNARKGSNRARGRTDADCATPFLFSRKRARISKPTPHEVTILSRLDFSKPEVTAPPSPPPPPPRARRRFQRLILMESSRERGCERRCAYCC